MKTPLERVKDYIARTGASDAERIRLAMRRKSEGPVPMAVIRAVLAGRPAPEVKVSVDGKPAKTSPEAGVKKLTIEDVMRQYHVPTKIKSTISSHLEGRNALYDDDSFRKLCEVPVQNWRRNADLAEFASNKIKISSVLHWGSVENCKRIKQML
jgi:hypothetical protein